MSKTKKMSGPEFLVHVMNASNDPADYKPSINPDSPNFDPYLAAEVEAAQAEPVVKNWEVKAIAAGKGILKRADLNPDERRKHDNAMAAQRARRARQIARRKKEQEAVVEQPMDPKRVRAGLVILTEMHPLISKVVLGRYNQMRRVLGDISAYDVAQDVLMGSAEGIAKQDKHDLVDLLIAARWLDKQPGIPQVVDREAPTGAKWLMGVVQRQTTHRLADIYRSSVVSIEYEEVGPDGAKEIVKVCRTLESLDYLDTILANTGGVDTLLTHTKAAQAPGMVGTRFQIPGQTDRAFVGMVVDAAITERGLDWLADMLLDDDKRRTDGAFMWTANYVEIWTRLQTDLPWLPDLPGDNERTHVVLVRKAVGALFEYLSTVVGNAYDLASEPALLNEYTQGAHIGGREWGPVATSILTDAEDDIQAEHDTSPMMGAGALADLVSGMANGSGYVMEGADDENPQMTYFGSRPDASEWSKVRKVEPSPLTCKHGQRKTVYGQSKKARKQPRGWKGEMCPQPQGAPDACPPIFNGKELAPAPAPVVVEHVTPTDKRMKKAKKALDTIVKQEA